MPPVDLKKKYKELYRPKIAPSVIDIPEASYVAVEGVGDPNEKNGSYHDALTVLYSVAYTIKMCGKTADIKGFYDFVVSPLEGMWYPRTSSDKSDFRWISMLRLPEFVDEEVLEWAKAAASEKKKIDTSSAKMMTFTEGLCVQSIHIGSYDKEDDTIAAMDRFLAENSYENDINGSRLHHEIYLSDPKRIPTERRKTIIRHPIKPVR